MKRAEKLTNDYSGNGIINGIGKMRKFPTIGGYIEDVATLLVICQFHLGRVTLKFSSRQVNKAELVLTRLLLNVTNKQFNNNSRILSST